MSMPRLATSTAALSLLSTAALILLSAPAVAQSPQLGRPAAPEDIAAFDIDISPDGKNLPRGSGTPGQGELVFNAKCLTCHGEKGAGKPHDALVGGRGTLVGDQTPIKTVGSYWPYATTVFDYVRRAMPLNAPKSLTDDEVYSVVAYILQQNGVIGDSEIIDANSLPAVRMPNRDGFKPFARGG